MNILITPTSFISNEKVLKQISEKANVTLNTRGHSLSEEELLSFTWDFDGYIAGLDNITSRVLEKASPKLKVISRYGVGFENVDVKAAGKLGITVTNTPGANTDSVADLTFALILSAARNIPTLNYAVKQGEWPRRQGIEVYGKTLGIIGLGSIGRAVANRAMGFSMKIKAFDPYVFKSPDYNIEMCDIDTLFKVSDIISLHVPLNKETEKIIKKENILKMKDGVIIINTSRGGLINEEDAAFYLESGKIAAIGVDAFYEEPPKNCALLKYPNVIATPHTGAHTKEATNKMAEFAVSNLFDILEGRDNKYVVNKTYLGGVCI